MVVPYLTWALFYGKLNLSTVPEILWGTNISLYYAGSNSVLWFLPTMFLASVLYQIYLEICAITFNHRKLITAISLGICFILVNVFKQIWMPWCHIWGIDIAFTSVIFMICGNLLSPVVEKLRTKKFISLIIVAIVLGVSIYTTKQNADESVGGYIYVYANYGKSYYIYIVNALAICFAIIVVSFFFEKSKVLKRLGEYSLAIMVLHYFVFEITVPWFSGMVQINAILATTLNTIITLIVCIPFVFVLMHVLPESIGKCSKIYEKKD